MLRLAFIIEKYKSGNISDLIQIPLSADDFFFLSLETFEFETYEIFSSFIFCKENICEGICFVNCLDSTLETRFMGFQGTDCVYPI